MNRISQFLVYPIVWFFSTFVFEVEFKNENGLASAIGKPMIIIGNHISFYDSFLLRLNKHWTSLSVYFMGVVKFNDPKMRFLYKIGIISLVYKLFGVFVIQPGLGIDKNLEVPQKLLLKGNHVFIFPEGSVNHTSELLPFKHGAAKLSILTNVPILPIGFTKTHNGTKEKIVITIGEVVTFPTGMEFTEVTNILQGKIAELIK